MNKEYIYYWISSAEHDLEAAKSMFQSGKYFCCRFKLKTLLKKIL